MTLIKLAMVFGTADNLELLLGANNAAITKYNNVPKLRTIVLPWHSH